MRVRRSIAILGSLVVASLLCIARAAAIDVAPPGAGFSVAFPVQPKAETQSEPGAESHLFIADNEGLRYMVGYTDYAEMAPVETEFEADLRNFLKAISARALSQKRTTFPSANRAPLPALEFTYSGETISGRASSWSTAVAPIASSASSPTTTAATPLGSTGSSVPSSSGRENRVPVAA